MVEDELQSRKSPEVAPNSRLQPDSDSRVDTVAVYEGSSSFASQSMQATEDFQRVSYSHGTVDGSSLDASFRHLQDLLQPSTTFNDYRFSRNIAPQPAAQMTLLPVELILAVLRKIKGMSPCISRRLSSEKEFSVSDSIDHHRQCNRLFSSHPIS